MLVGWCLWPEEVVTGVNGERQRVNRRKKGKKKRKKKEKEKRERESVRVTNQWVRENLMVIG